MNRDRVVKMVSVLSVSAMLVAGLIISCSGGKSSDNGPGTVTYTDATQATGGASSAKASVDLSSSISDAASGLSSFSNSSGYSAPGKGGATTTDTSSIASIDPRLKKLVDGMMASMKTPAVTSAVSKARASKAKVSMSPGTQGHWTFSGVCSGGTGTFNISADDTSDIGGAYVAYTVNIYFDSCRDAIDPITGLYSVTTGTIHAYDKKMAGNTANTRNATIDLTAQKYNISDALMATDVAKGTFNSNDSGTSTSRTGRNTANGSFSEHDVAMSETGTFYFTNLASDWTWDVDLAGVETVANTGNGNFGLLLAPDYGQSLRLNIGLSNLINKAQKNVDLSWDQWVNGSITIGWTPDLSALGCKSGRITFTTSDLTPLHFATLDSTCPSSGTLQVNNATISYYDPNIDVNNIVITVGTSSASVPDCTGLQGGICS